MPPGLIDMADELLGQLFFLNVERSEILLKRKVGEAVHAALFLHQQGAGVFNHAEKRGWFGIGSD
jgi:hypothetical protein